MRTYQRLESGGLKNPPIRHLVNCALAFGVDLEEVCEPEWLEWTPSHPSRAKPRRLTTRQETAIAQWRRRGRS